MLYPLEFSEGPGRPSRAATVPQEGATLRAL